MSMDMETDFDGILVHLNEIGCNLLKIVNDVITQANDITHAGRDLTLEGYLDDAATSLVKVHDNLYKARRYVQEQKELREGYYVFSVNGTAIRYKAVKDLPDGCIVAFRSIDWKYLGNLPIRKDDERFPNPDSLEESVRLAAEMGLLPELAKECNIAETKAGGE